MMRHWTWNLLSRVVLFVTVVGLVTHVAWAEDWPQWQHDGQRSGISQEKLPDQLHLQWIREFPTPQPAWPEVSRLLFDQSYEPVVLGKQIFVPSNSRDCLTALHTETGEVQWRFYADGPIRFAPVAWNNHVYFGSDDGHLYALRTADGTLAWKFRGGPTGRKILGNGRMISVWPVRGGPVLDQGRIYFTAGIWPFLGIFAHALDAETGQLIWTNDTTGAIYIGGKGGRGASPQGYLTAKSTAQLNPLDREIGDIVIAPCGGSAPVLFAQHDGTLKHFGGFVPFFANEESQARYKSEKNFGFKKGGAGGWFVNTPNVLSDEYQPYQPEITAGGKTWNRTNCPPVDGEITSILAADQKLFIVTNLGHIHCFGGQQGEARRHVLPEVEAKPVAVDSQLAEFVQQNQLATVPGVCLMLGDHPETLSSLVASTELEVVVIPRAGKESALREHFHQQQRYGQRVHVLPSGTNIADLPSYVARLIVADGVESASDRRQLADTYARLRPYGGVLCLTLTDDQHAQFAANVQAAELPQAKLERDKDLTRLVRVGPLPDAGEWTHEHGDAGNTLFSKDGRVRSPLGVLWFGGENAQEYAYQADPILVAGGRMFLYTRNRVMAVDVYTGKVLWKNGPRAGGPLPCYAAAVDGYYSGGANAQGLAQVIKLDVETGLAAGEVLLDPQAGPLKEIRIWKDTLIVTTPTQVLAFDRHTLAKRWQRTAVLARTTRPAKLIAFLVFEE